MQTLPIDLKKTPEIADAVAGMEPGDKVVIHGTIKSLDDQTLVVTLEELEVPEERSEEDRPIGGNEGSAGAPIGTMEDLDAEEAAI